MVWKNVVVNYFLNVLSLRNPLIASCNNLEEREMRRFFEFFAPQPQKPYDTMSSKELCVLLRTTVPGLEGYSDYELYRYYRASNSDGFGMGESMGLFQKLIGNPNQEVCLIFLAFGQNYNKYSGSKISDHSVH